MSDIDREWLQRELTEAVAALDRYYALVDHRPETLELVEMLSELQKRVTTATTALRDYEAGT